MPTTAVVRPVSPHLAAAELTHLERRPVDVERARTQHAGYRGLLVELGLDVVAAPALPAHPDGVFVEDTAVVVDDLAVLTRPGAAARRGEVASIGDVLAGRGRRTARITAPATIDGGDVLQVGHTLFVGRSTRTDDAGIAQLRRLVAPMGRTVDVTGALHLKTAATALPDGTVLAVRSWLDTRAFTDREVVAAPEPAGANVLLVDDTVVLSASAPRTAELVAARGWDVRQVELSEFERVEAGPTCLCLLC